MCTGCAPVSHTPAQADAFAGRLLNTLNEAGIAMMISLGHRTGLFDAMADGLWYQTAELAHRAGCSPRYVREWLGAMTVGRIVEHDPMRGMYRLPGAHAACLTRHAAPGNLAAAMQWVSTLGAVETLVAEAFMHGRGVAYQAYERFGPVMEEESLQTVVGGLEQNILPLMPGMTQRLTQGIDVLDVGCGRGRTMVEMAARFPQSRFTGYDLLADAVEATRSAAVERGLTNLRFEVLDCSTMDHEAAFDLITTFDAIHDQARPEQVLANIRRALRPGGVYLCQEIKAESDHAGNMDHPVAPFLYTISTMHCMSVSLAHGGAGLGAMWGRKACRDLLGRAGFCQVKMHELPHDIMNDWYVCQP